MPFSSRSFSFDAGSVMLFAAITAGSASLQAQTSLPEPPTAMAGSGGPGNGAHTPAPSTVRAFQRADADQDGRLSPAEAARLPAIADRFTQLDRDGDGFLSQAEFDAGARL